MPERFHSRLSAVRKTYAYYVETADRKCVFERKYVYGLGRELDIPAMEKAAGYLLGEHDFSSFCSSGHQAEETVRTLYDISVDRGTDDIITIRLKGNGFLYNMVRIIAGTLMKVGMGVWPPEHVKEILEARDRKEAGETAPARGLTMVGIEYEKEPALTVTGENEHWSYILDQTELETSKTAVLKILFCEPEEVIRLVRRMVHQAYWNGAETVFIEAPEACGLNGAETYGFYRLVQAENGRWRAVEKRLV